MAGPLFSVRRRLPADLCEHCGELVDRVWLVPGDVLDSCAGCYEQEVGRAPVHEQGHSRPGVPAVGARPAASFYLRTDGRRPA